jgi:5-(carboxyamino)imidazole ribonucleotide synthase
MTRQAVNPKPEAFLPPACIGILGGGQLGRYLAIAAQRLGYKVAVWSQGSDSPAFAVAHFTYNAPWNNAATLEAFSQQADVITLEFENIPLAVLEAIEVKGKCLRPSSAFIRLSQHRAYEKQALSALGLPTAPYAVINAAGDLKAAAQTVGFPAVLKTASLGYDGKGQRKVDEPAALQQAWQALGEVPCVLEAWLTFKRELSLLAVRGADGAFKAYPLLENHHQNHVLHVTMFPAPQVTSLMQKEAETYAHKLMQAHNYIGLLCVELFELPNGNLLVNEVAPRPHNSGHLTLEAHGCSQYEQQLRAVCGLPLGGIEALVSQAMMVNVLGDVWETHPEETPNWPALLALPDAPCLHLYGKQNAKAGRKMGHLISLNLQIEPLSVEVLLAQANRYLETLQGTSNKEKSPLSLNKTLRF